MVIVDSFDAPTSALVRVAKLHYEFAMTHQDIADSLGLSRVKVTRMLSEARRTGIVEVTVHGSEHPFVNLEEQLCARFGLSHAWVAPFVADQEPVTTPTRLVGAQCLMERLPQARVIAMGASATVAAALTAVSGIQAANTRFVPFAGGYGGISRGLDPNELALHLASSLQARCYNLPAPLLAGDAISAEALRALPAVAESLSLARSADTLIFGIGGAEWAASPLRDQVAPAEWQALVAQGAVGDISGRFFDQDGNAIGGAPDDRVIGLTLAEMGAADTRIALAHGVQKLPAIYAALVGGHITTLVTDTVTAQRLLSRS